MPIFSPPQFIIQVLNAIKKIVAALAKFKNSISEDSKGLFVVLVFIGWIAVSNYKDKHDKNDKDNIDNSI